MFCSECGKPAHGKFCSYCGTPLALDVPQVQPGLNMVPSDKATEPPGPELASIEPGSLDADNEVRYEAILKFPGVREKIDRHARQAPKRLSGEEFLALADKYIPMGVPMEKLAAVVQPLYTKLGIKTGKERAHEIPAPVGKVIVRALCSMARHGQALRGVTQAEDGCLIEASLPSDMLSLEGTLLVSVHRQGPHTAVIGRTHIGGQFFDLGKSNRCLEQLFVDLAREAA